MRPPSPAALEDHNRRQRSYFDRIVKPTMVPVDTPYLRRHVEELVRFGGVRSGQRLLEVGCGMGRYTLILAGRGLQVEGLDLSPVLLERLRSYNGGRFQIPLHCADVLQPPPELEGRFDAVAGFFTLHHLHDLEGCFTAMARLLHPGGRIVFLEPNPYNPLYYVQILVTPGMTWEGDGGILRMRRGLVLGAMERVGFGELAMRRFGFFPPFLANRPWGSRIESILEGVPFWRAVLPFQLFRGTLPASPRQTNGSGSR